MKINLCDHTSCPLYYKESSKEISSNVSIDDKKDYKINIATTDTVYINLGYIEFPIYCLLCKHAKKFDVEKLLERKEALDLLSK